ncbi:MAG: HprK-related kinase A [Gammaproteobacteria bacterium]|nr:MAG: HprK-related kinase A [Gammaproteobacteria bacterium]
MKVSSLPITELKGRLSAEGLGLCIGPFNIKLTSSLAVVADGLEQLYGDFDLTKESDFTDFRISLAAPSLLRRWFRPQVNFSFDGFIPFKPLPQEQAFAMFEWGLNWCVANNAHQYLIIHAAVIERNGVTCILPGTPGSGKSTLCAGMVCKGWRLLSDEMTLISTSTGEIFPIPRPVSLKNQSIEIIQNYSSHAFMGETVMDTAKGTVSHMRPPNSSVDSSGQPGKAGLIIFPKYKEGEDANLTPLNRANALLKMAENSFNYSVLGLQGFEVLSALISNCDCYDFSYQSLDEAKEVLESLI